MTTTNSERVRDAWDRVLDDRDVNAVKAWLDDQTGQVPAPYEAIHKVLFAPCVHRALVNDVEITSWNARLRGAS